MSEVFFLFPSEMKKLIHCRRLAVQIKLMKVKKKTLANHSNETRVDILFWVKRI